MLEARSIIIKRQDGTEIEVDGAKTIREALEINKMDNRIIEVNNQAIKGIDLCHGVAYGADFSGSDLSKDGERPSDLSYLWATGALFNGANLTGALLAFVDLDGADLRGCDLTDCTFSNGRIGGALLDGAILNWTQHRFPYEILRRTLLEDGGENYAETETRRVEVAALFLAQDAGDIRNFETLLASLPDKDRDWVLETCAPFVMPSDNAPDILRAI